MEETKQTVLTALQAEVSQAASERDQKKKDEQLTLDDIKSICVIERTEDKKNKVTGNPFKLLFLRFADGRLKSKPMSFADEKAVAEAKENRFEITSEKNKGQFFLVLKPVPVSKPVVGQQGPEAML